MQMTTPMTMPMSIPDYQYQYQYQYLYRRQFRSRIPSRLGNMGMQDDHESICVRSMGWGQVLGRVLVMVWVCVDEVMPIEADGEGRREKEVDLRQQNQNHGINRMKDRMDLLAIFFAYRDFIW